MSYWESPTFYSTRTRRFERDYGSRLNRLEEAEYTATPNRQRYYTPYQFPLVYTSYQNAWNSYQNIWNYTAYENAGRNREEERRRGHGRRIDVPIVRDYTSNNVNVARTIIFGSAASTSTTATNITPSIGRNTPISNTQETVTVASRTQSPILTGILPSTSIIDANADASNDSLVHRQTSDAAATEILSQKPTAANNVYVMCPVCFNEYGSVVSSGSYFVTTKCGHIICKDCTRRLLSQRMVCPKCRSPLYYSELRKLFL